LALVGLVNPIEQLMAATALILYSAQSLQQAVAAEEETTILVQRKLVRLAALAAAVLLAGQVARLPAVLAIRRQQVQAKVIQVAQAHLQLGTALAAAAALQQLAAMGLVQTVELVAQEQPLVLAAAA
jgi:hypothetical protein